MLHSRQVPTTPRFYLSNVIHWPIDWGHNDCVATVKPVGLAYLMRWSQISVSTYGTFGKN